MNDSMKRAFQGVSEEEQNKQEQAYKNKLRSLVGMAPSPTGTDIPQNTAPYVPGVSLQPRAAILANSPRPNDTGAMANTLNNIDQADKINQMKQLQDLEDAGAFEAQDSESNIRAAKLRALLGK